MLVGNMLVLAVMVLPLLALVNCDTQGFNSIVGLPQDETLQSPAICPYTATSPGVSIGGVEYLLSMREDYGWGSSPHRAIIALALNSFGDSTDDEIKLMLHQLDVELSIALLRSQSEPMVPNDLALYISALISVDRNPRDFHGRNLVAILEDHARKPDVHPYVILTLCNARAITHRHLKHLVRYINEENHSDRQFMELKALSLKAYFCAKEDNVLPAVKVDTEKALQCLIELQKSDGRFGNVYTTSLAMQALIAADNEYWREDDAVAYMLTQRTVDVSIISTYYIEMALRSRDIKFLKRLNKKQEIKQTDLDILLGLPKEQIVYYNIKIGKDPQASLTLALKVPLNVTFFQVMKLAAHENPAFRFQDYETKEGNHEIYSISDVPNDSERGLYWNLLLNTRPKYLVIQKPPNKIIPQDSDNFIYWYKESLDLMRDFKETG